MKFMHIADVHLGAVPDAGMSWSEERRQEIWEGFDGILAEAQAQAVDFLFISGDLFHRQPLLRELKELNYKFNKLKPMRVMIIAGNHDYLKPNSYYLSIPWADNVCFFKEQEAKCFYFEEQNTYIYGLSYTDYEITKPLYDQLHPVAGEGCHILLAHGGDARHVPMNYEQMAEAGFDYIAMGHIHIPKMMKDGKMAYAGALQPIDRNDTGKHGYILGSWEDGQLSVTFVPFANREYIHLTVEMDGSMPWGMAVDYIRSEIERLGRQHIYKIILSGFRDPDIEIVPEDVYRLGRIVELVDDTRPDYDFDEIYAQNKDNILGMYIEKIRNLPSEEASKDKVLYYGLKALFETMR